MGLGVGPGVGLGIGGPEKGRWVGIHLSQNNKWVAFVVVSVVGGRGGWGRMRAEEKCRASKVRPVRCTLSERCTRSALMEDHSGRRYERKKREAGSAPPPPPACQTPKARRKAAAASCAARLPTAADTAAPNEPSRPERRRRRREVQGQGRQGEQETEETAAFCGRVAGDKGGTRNTHLNACAGADAAVL